MFGKTVKGYNHLSQR